MHNELGARVWRLHEAITFLCSPILQPFMEKIYEKRSVPKTEGHADGEQTLKLVMNSIYGKTVQDCSRFKNTSVYTNVNAFQKAQANPRMVDYDFFVLCAHHRSKAQTPEQPHPDWMANARVSSADAHEVLLQRFQALFSLE